MGRADRPVGVAQPNGRPGGHVLRPARRHWLRAINRGSRFGRVGWSSQVGPVRRGGPDGRVGTARSVRSRPRQDRRPRHQGRAPAAAGRANRARPGGSDRGRPSGRPRRRPPRRRTLLYRGAPDRPGPVCGRDRRRRRHQRAPALPAVRRRRQLGPRHILSRRLQLAHSILSSAASPDRAGRGAWSASGTGGARTVADVATSCGFTSATYFSHAFRQHFGHRQATSAARPPA